MVQEGLAEKVRGELVILQPTILERRISGNLERAD